MELTEKLEKKLEDQTWIDTQDSEFINFLRDVLSAIELLSVQVILFTSAHEQFVKLLNEGYILGEGLGIGDSQDGYDKPIPTQTSRGAESA